MVFNNIKVIHCHLSSHPFSLFENANTFSHHIHLNKQLNLLLFHGKYHLNNIEYTISVHSPDSKLIYQEYHRFDPLYDILHSQIHSITCVQPHKTSIKKLVNFVLIY